jgi:hypothetical protein
MLTLSPTASKCMPNVSAVASNAGMLSRALHRLRDKSPLRTQAPFSHFNDAAAAKYMATRATPKGHSAAVSKTASVCSFPCPSALPAATHGQAVSPRAFIVECSCHTRSGAEPVLAVNETRVLPANYTSFSPHRPFFVLTFLLFLRKKKA